MINRKKLLCWIMVYAVVLSSIGAVFVIGSRAASTMNQEEFDLGRKCIIIDAGHGGVDGGATSCTGVLESSINLQIALRLDDLLHLIGIKTVMIRTEDISVYTEGESIAAKKVSDLKQRVRIVNGTANGILISIHQNFFAQSICTGAQVFYGSHRDGEQLARQLQQKFIETVNPDSKRSAKNASGIYLMEQVNCPAILIECGFLSNPAEEELLRSSEYQKMVCSVIANTLSEFINSSPYIA